MIHIKTLVARLLKPGTPWKIGLTLLCMPCLFFIFTTGSQQSAFAYVAYLASAYTLTVWVVWSIGMVTRIRSAVYAHPFGFRYLTDLPLRGRLSLCSTTVIHFCYALFELVNAFLHRSFWLGSLSVYYLILAAARGVLLRSIYKHSDERRQQLLTAKLCGWLLLAMNIAFSSVTAQMVLDGKGYTYPGTMIFAMAFYSFYSVTISIVNFVRFRKLKSPVLSASKILGVATAMVSMLSLQTAMFAAFGGEYAHRRLMNALTGGAVCLLLFLMAIGMIIGTKMELKKSAVQTSI